MLSQLRQLPPVAHAVCQLEDIIRSHISCRTAWELLECQRYCGNPSHNICLEVSYFSDFASWLETLAEGLRIANSDSDLLHAA